MFQEPERAARGLPTAAIALAGIAVLVLVALFVILGRHRPGPASGGGLGPADAAYASHLQLSDLQMSESTSFSGGKETFVDGRVTNHGSGTVTGITVQVSFPADTGAPQQESVPLSLIRTRQPYIDTQPVSAAPLAPGASAEFRLTFDDVRPDWNQQVPVVQVTSVNLR